MPVRFNPSGELNVASDASDLPFETGGKVITSSAMTRCTNLHLDRAGIASTRRGSTRLSDAVIATPVHRVVEQGGVRYAFGGTAIYRNGVSIASGLTSAKWSAVKYNAYNVLTQSIFAVNGTDRKRVTGSTVAEWGIDAPTVAPVPIIAGTTVGTQTWESTNGSEATLWTAVANPEHHPVGTFRVQYSWEPRITSDTDTNAYAYVWAFELAPNTGQYQWDVIYTYCRKDGTTLECESNPSDASGVIENSGFLSVAWTTPSDTQVTHVHIYRTIPFGTSYYYAGEFTIGASPGLIDATDAELGSEAEYDHDRIPVGATVVSGPDFGGTLFAAVGNLLYFCKPNQPEYWPATYYVEVASPQEAMKSIALFNGQAYALTNRDIYLIQGTGHQSFFPLRQSAATGTIAQDGVLAMRGIGVLHVASDGLWGLSGSSDDNITNANFRPVFQGTTTQGIDGRVLANMANCWLLSHLGKLYFGFPGGTATYPSEVLVMDLGTKRFSHYDYGQEFSAVCVDDTNSRILAADDAGYLWVLEDDSVTTDNAAEISWDWQSAEASDQMRIYMPRSAKYDVTVGGTATAQVLLDGASIQSHALAGSRVTTKRLIAGDNGKRLQSRIYGTGSVDIWAVELE
jgi:hypothetical protein